MKQMQSGKENRPINIPKKVAESCHMKKGSGFKKPQKNDRFVGDPNQKKDGPPQKEVKVE